MSNAITWGMPCYPSAHPQTGLSKGLRITSLALGVILSLTGTLNLIGVGGLAHIGIAAGSSMLAGGIVLMLSAIGLQCVNRRLDRVERFQPRAYRFPGNLDREFGDYTVLNGRGDFVICSKSGRIIEEGLYKKAYEILNKYSVFSFINEDPHWLRGGYQRHYSHRHEEITAELEQLDPDLSIVFIPTTLTELFFIHACIDEDIQAKSICKLADCSLHTDKAFQEQKEELKRKKAETCWHLCHFTDQGDAMHPDVIKIAYRLNQLIIDKIKTIGSVQPLKFDQISKLLEKEISFLKEYHQKCKNGQMKNLKGKELSNCTYSNATTHFGYESIRCYIRPMGIRNDNDAQILRRIVTLECSVESLNNVFLFRGAKYEEERPYFTHNHYEPFSRSYGFTAFAGAPYDAEACAFHYMRNDTLDAFVIAIPFEKVKHSPFYVPQSNTICGLLGEGEIFHGRNRVWEEIDHKPAGIRQGEKRWEHLKSNIPREQYLDEMNEYYNHQIYFLK